LNTTVKKWGTSALLLGMATVAALLLWRHFQGDGLDERIASSNGRIEAVEIDIATPRAGKVKEIFADEGDYVETGKILAKMDTAVLKAQQRETLAHLRQAESSVRIANSQVVDLLHGLVDREADRVVEVLLDWSGDAKIDMDSLKLEIDGLVDRYHGVPLKELNISNILADLTTLLRDYHLALPPDLTLLAKALISLEGMGCQLDPEFDMVSEFSPFLRRAIMARYAPDALAKRGWQAVSGGLDILAAAVLACLS